VISTKKLMTFVKKRNEVFKGDFHQDCHEYFIWFLNELNDTLKKKKGKKFFCLIELKIIKREFALIYLKI
jgi:ubiquitin C-terminal hydrolase